MSKILFIFFLGIFSLLQTQVQAQVQAQADPSSGPENPWEKIRTPIVRDGETNPVGFYSLGCIIGAEKMEISTKVWEVVNVFRNRYYGQPEMREFLEYLGTEVARTKKKKIVLGDISLPGGGPTVSGHASHQTGLDIDIRYRFVDVDKTLDDGERSHFAAPDIAIHKVDEIKKGTQTKYVLTTQLVGKKLASDVVESLRIAASYPSTERIFVSPPIKKALCEIYKPGTDGSYPTWLLKVSPYFGHADHYHVRLGCPANEPDCKKQDPVVPHKNDPTKVGCAGSNLEWWYATDPKEDSFFKDQIDELKKPPGPTPPPSWIAKMCKLPRKCRDLVNMAPFSCPKEEEKPPRRAELFDPETITPERIPIPVKQD